MNLSLQKLRPATTYEKFFDRNDQFAATMKSFNFEGRQKVHSSVGVLMTVLVKVILYSYGIKMFTKLIKKDNPNVYTELQPESYSDEMHTLDMGVVSNEEVYSQNKKPFKFAFAMRGYLDHEIKNKTNMVEWEVHVYKGNGSSEYTEFEVGVHACNDSDYKDFYTLSKKSKPRFDDFKEKGSFLCMNDYDVNGLKVDKNLFGPDENTPHRRFELIFKPCKPTVMTADQDYNTTCLVRNKTRAAYDEKLKEIITYIGMAELIFAYNVEKMNLKEFGEKSIIRDA